MGSRCDRGYTKLKESETTFSRLIIGFPDGKKLRYIGAVGSGFTQKSYKEILSKLKPSKSYPFDDKPDPNKASGYRRKSSDIIYWVKPEHKCLIRYQEITNDGLLRMPKIIYIKSV